MQKEAVICLLELHHQLEARMAPKPALSNLSALTPTLGKLSLPLAKS